MIVDFFFVTCVSLINFNAITIFGAFKITGFDLSDYSHMMCY